MKLNKLTMAGLIISGGLLLSACGGGGSSPAVQAQNDTTATINKDTGATVIPAVNGKSLTFSAGVPALGTSNATTVAISGTGVAPTFSVASDGATATGDMTFGSCIFTVKVSTFPVGHPMSVGRITTVNPCSLIVATRGVLVGGSADLPVSLVLGATRSTPLQLPVIIGSNGSVAVNGTTVGTTPVLAATGGGN